MRPFNIYPAIFLLFLAQMAISQETENGNYYGEAFKITDAIQRNMPVYDQLTVTDTVTTQMTGTIKEVCQVKGCWMKVALDAEGCSGQNCLHEWTGLFGRNVG